MTTNKITDINEFKQQREKSNIISIMKDVLGDFTYSEIINTDLSKYEHFNDDEY